VVNSDVSDVAREVDVTMLTINYKIKNLSLTEVWFSSKLSTNKSSLLQFCCYRDSRVNKNLLGLKKEVKHTLINDLTQEEEELFATFKPNVRNEIRKHNKIENFVYHSDFTSQKVFLDFYKTFAEAKKLANIRKHSIDKYGENLFYVHGDLDGYLTNMQVYLIDKNSGIVRLLHSISRLYEKDITIKGFTPEQEKASYRKKATKIGWINRYLHWYTMLYFKEKGFKTFDWGGYTNNPNSSLAGIDKFKASFGGKKIELYDYYTLPYYTMKVIQERIL
jgi:lipid II:glycine glycyltransferase (peptidoglycan interpeptide bridge formation enzyme)